MSDNTAAQNETALRAFGYDESPPNLSDSTRVILETYAKIAPDEVVKHCIAIRDRAWRIFHYPCIGQWRFLDLSIAKSDEYDQILSRIKAGDLYLDVGCCFGQDIRKLVVDGAPSENLYGTDLRKEFFELGYELFRDRDSLKAKFIAADIFSPGAAYDELQGKVSIIHASSFFHLFSWEDQQRVAREMLKLLVHKSGAMILGRHAGARQAGIKPGRVSVGDRYRHDETSFKKFWKEMGDETGLQFKVDVRAMDVWPEATNQSNVLTLPVEYRDATAMRYCVTML